MLTYDELLENIAKEKKHTFISTGMSTMEQIEHAVEVLGTDDLIILHSTSTYPSKTEELNLQMIKLLQSKFPVPIGYSGHEVGLAPTYAATVLGATVLERHITIDRAMWGSDQAASVEPQGLRRLMQDIRDWRIMQGDGIKKVYDSEIPIIEKLRRKG